MRFGAVLRAYKFWIPRSCVCFCVYQCLADVSDRLFYLLFCNFLTINGCVLINLSVMTLDVSYHCFVLILWLRFIRDRRPAGRDRRDWNPGWYRCYGNPGSARSHRRGRRYRYPGQYRIYRIHGLRRPDWGHGRSGAAGGHRRLGQPGCGG